MTTDTWLLLIGSFVFLFLVFAWAMARVSADTEPVHEDAGEYDE